MYKMSFLLPIELELLCKERGRADTISIEHLIAFVDTIDILRL
jgi:hypothetical protein